MFPIQKKAKNIRVRVCHSLRLHQFRVLVVVRSLVFAYLFLPPSRLVDCLGFVFLHLLVVILLVAPSPHSIQFVISINLSYSLSI